MIHRSHFSTSDAYGQQGVVLFVALVVLVIMTLAGISMMRQIGGGQMIAGNLAFKQSATSSADRGTEAARNLVMISATVILDADQPASGYFATTAPPVAAFTSTPGQPFNPATYKWDVANASFEDTAGDGAGNRVQHVIHRLCPSIGPIEGQLCTTMVNTDGGDKGGTDYTKPPLVTDQKPYFRVTTRVTGPRNTSSYTQVLLY